MELQQSNQAKVEAKKACETLILIEKGDAIFLTGKPLCTTDPLLMARDHPFLIIQLARNPPCQAP
jgi:hypothetical protein